MSASAPAFLPPSEADAFRNFAYGLQGGGPISGTGAALGYAPPQASAAPAAALPGGRSPAASPYAPLDSDVNDRVRSQSAHLLGALRMRSSMAASDPHWPYRFWRDLESLNAHEGLEYSLHRVMEAHGYLGSDTRGAPAPGLSEALKKLAEEGAPIVGAAGLPPTEIPRGGRRAQ